MNGDSKLQSYRVHESYFIVDPIGVLFPFWVCSLEVCTQTDTLYTVHVVLYTIILLSFSMELTAPLLN